MQQKESATPPTRRASSPKKRKASSPPPSPPSQRSSALQPSVPQTPEEWRAHWHAQGQPWRTEPEIGVQRQEELAKCRTITPDIEKGIYPLSGMKLTRADIEWLLATHENGRGPVDWSDESQRERHGLDLRGANLSESNLAELPLARLIGGFRYDELSFVSEEQKVLAGAILTNADDSVSSYGVHSFGSFLVFLIKHDRGDNASSSHG